MTQPIDVKLSLDSESGVWDIGLDENGDLEKDLGFGTPLGISVFDEQRASEGEVAIPELRRGWVGNLLSDDQEFEQGSKLWLLDQARINESTVTSAKNYIQEALTWFVEDGFASKIQVETSSNGANLLATINIDGQFFYLDLWNQTIYETVLSA